MAGQAAKKAAAAKPAAVKDETPAAAPVEERTSEPAAETSPQVEGLGDNGGEAGQVDGTPPEAHGEPAPLGAGTANAAVGEEDTVRVTASDRIEGVYDEVDGDGDSFVTINKDVVEQFYYPGTKRPAERILFTRGQVVKKSYIDALNARVDAGRGVTSDAVAE